MLTDGHDFFPLEYKKYIYETYILRKCIPGQQRGIEIIRASGWSLNLRTNKVNQKLRHNLELRARAFYRIGSTLYQCDEVKTTLISCWFDGMYLLDIIDSQQIELWVQKMLEFSSTES